MSHAPAPRGVSVDATAPKVRGALVLWLLLLPLLLLAAPESAAAARCSAQDPVPPAEYTPVLHAGRIAVADFLLFMQIQEQRQVSISDELDEQPHFGPAAEIEVLTDIEPLTFPIVVALLEANDYVVARRTRDAEEVLEVSYRARGERRSRPRRRPTIAVPLEHLATKPAQRLLEKALRILSPSQRRQLRIAASGDERTLVFRAEAETLRQVAFLLERIDIPAADQELDIAVTEVRERPGERARAGEDIDASPYRVRVITLKHLAADDAARLLREIASVRESELAREETRTLFLPEKTAPRLVIRYSSLERLEEYLELVEILDQPAPAEPIYVMREWNCQHRDASEIARELRANWELKGIGAISLLTLGSEKTLILRVPESLWETVQEWLRALDRPQEELRRNG